MTKDNNEIPVMKDIDYLLTPVEYKIIRDQIRKNGEVIEDYIDRIDLLVNKEGYPRAAPEVERLRSRLSLLMEENDTFRKVFWRHIQIAERFIDFQTSLPDPITFLVNKIKERDRARLCSSSSKKDN